MSTDFRKLTAWIEQTLQIGVAEEQKVLEWKLADKSRPATHKVEDSEPTKAS